jgi:hypothetical protein
MRMVISTCGISFNWKPNAHVNVSHRLSPDPSLLSMASLAPTAPLFPVPPNPNPVVLKDTFPRVDSGTVLPSTNTQRPMEQRELAAAW